MMRDYPSELPAAGGTAAYAEWVARRIEELQQSPRTVAAGAKVPYSTLNDLLGYPDRQHRTRQLVTRLTTYLGGNVEQALHLVGYDQLSRAEHIHLDGDPIAAPLA